MEYSKNFKSSSESKYFGSLWCFLVLILTSTASHKQSQFLVKSEIDDFKSIPYHQDAIFYTQKHSNGLNLRLLGILNQIALILDPAAVHSQCDLYINKTLSRPQQNYSIGYNESFIPLIVHVNLSNTISFYDAESILKCIEFYPRYTIWIFHNINTNTSEFQNYKFRLTDRIYLINNTNTIIEVYGIKGELILKDISSDTNISALFRRLDFGGVQLEIAHVNKLEVLTDSGSSTLAYKDSWSSDDLSYRFLAFMQDLLHFKTKFHKADSWIQAQSNTTYSMADLLDNGVVDLALSSTGFTDNLNYSFLYVTRVHKEIYIYFHGTQQAVYGNLFKEIFSLNALFGVILICLFVLIFANLFFDDGQFNDLFIWTVAIFSQQGFEEELKTRYQLSSRIYFISASAFSFLFYTSTSAFLLTKFSIEDGIDNLQDLLDNKFTFGVLADSIIHNGFKIPKYHNPASPLWPIKNIYKAFPTEQEGIKSVLKSKKFAYITGQNVFLEFKDLEKDIKHNKNCEKLEQMIIYGDKRWGNAFVRSNSEFRNHFNYARTLMFQVGIVNRQMKIIRTQEDNSQPACSRRTESILEDSSLGNNKNHAIYLQEIRLIFYIFSTGIIFCLLIFTFEFCI